jgi:mRNA interferase RelE/StbE
VSKIKELCTNPEHLDIKKLQVAKYVLYHLRVGEFRVIYSLEHGVAAIRVVAVGYRKDIYRMLS